MSRIGKLPIPVPDGVEVALEAGNRLSVTGSRGKLERTFAPSMLINVETGTYGSVNYGLLLAGAVIAMVPCIMVYVGLQRYYVRGLVSGALKG